LSGIGEPAAIADYRELELRRDAEFRPICTRRHKMRPRAGGQEVVHPHFIHRHFIGDVQRRETQRPALMPGMEEVIGSNANVEQIEGRTRAGFKSSFSVPGAGIFTNLVPQSVELQLAIEPPGIMAPIGIVEFGFSSRGWPTSWSGESCLADPRRDRGWDSS
jgi:hypothetical protein